MCHPVCSFSSPRPVAVLVPRSSSTLFCDRSLSRRGEDEGARGERGGDRRGTTQRGEQRRTNKGGGTGQGRIVPRSGVEVAVCVVCVLSRCLVYSASSV